MRHAGPGQNMRFSDIVIDDASISMAAKGVFVTIGLLGSGCTVASLSKRASDAHKVVVAALEELIEAGYVTIDRDGEEERVFIRGPASFGVTS